MSKVDQEYFLEPYDHDYGLEEIFKSAGLNSVIKILKNLIGDFYIIDNKDNLVLGDKQEYRYSHDIDIEFETVGVLHYDDELDESTITAVDTTIKMVAAAYQKYIMASSLHIEAIHADYEEIKTKKEQLEISEEKYRSLSEQLDARVKQQVLVIEAKQKQLYQAERYSAIGRLAAGVAHEINNPMGFILSNLNTSKTYVANLIGFGELLTTAADKAELDKYWKEHEIEYDLEDFTDLIDESVSGGERIKAIVSALMVFSDADIEAVETVSVVDFVSSIADQIVIPDNKTITISKDIHEAAVIRCNPGLLKQVIINVLNNSVSAITETGSIRIEEHVSDDHDSVGVIIQDDGVGMNAETLGKVYDPFFTTCEVGKGVGLGLTVAKEVIVSMGGDISISSESGVGTSVTLSLPILHE